MNENGSAEQDGIKAALQEIDAAEAEIKKGDEDLKKAEADLRRVEEDQEICFKVDGEDYQTRKRHTTPNKIIEEFAKLHPAANYLVSIGGPSGETSYQNKGDTPIELRDGDSFQVISTGPATVSDGETLIGPAAFTAGLATAGYVAGSLPNKADHVYWDYPVTTGRFAGKTVRIGVVVPADFPMTVPAGLHVSPGLLPINPGPRVHPAGGISESSAFASLGGNWQYWSRQLTEWPKTKRTVAVYLNFVFKLWHTQ